MISVSGIVMSVYIASWEYIFIYYYFMRYLRDGWWCVCVLWGGGGGGFVCKIPCGLVCSGLR